MRISTVTAALALVATAVALPQGRRSGFAESQFESESSVATTRGGGLERGASSGGQRLRGDFSSSNTESSDELERSEEFSSTTVSDEEFESENTLSDAFSSTTGSNDEFEESEEFSATTVSDDELASERSSSDDFSFELADASSVEPIFSNGISATGQQQHLTTRVVMTCTDGEDVDVLLNTDKGAGDNPTASPRSNQFDNLPTDVVSLFLSGVDGETPGVVACTVEGDGLDPSADNVIFRSVDGDFNTLEVPEGFQPTNFLCRNEADVPAGISGSDTETDASQSSPLTEETQELDVQEVADSQSSELTGDNEELVFEDDSASQVSEVTADNSEFDEESELDEEPDLEFADESTTFV